MIKSNITKEDYLWGIIEELGWGTRTTDYKQISTEMKEMYPDDIIISLWEFINIKSKQLKNVLDAYAIEKNGTASYFWGIGDDALSDAIHHIIGLGKHLYYTVLDDPRKAKELINNDEYVESFRYVFNEKKKRKFIKKLLESVQYNDIYYHGTPYKVHAEGILESNMLIPGNRKDKKWFTPMENRVYLTPSLEYALPYVLNGVYMGIEYDEKRMKDEQFGYLFIVESKHIKDSVPDEDSIGEMVDEIYNGFKSVPYMSEKKQEFYQKLMKWEYKDRFIQEVKRILTDKQFNDIVKKHSGEVMYYANVGKKLNKHLSRTLLDDIINMGTEIAVLDGIPISECWKFDKLQSVNLKRNGSNFFELAERIR